MRRKKNISSSGIEESYFSNSDENFGVYENADVNAEPIKETQTEQPQKTEDEQIDFAEVEEEFNNFALMETKLRNGLLGKFVDGEYKIAPEIAGTLQKIKKTICESWNNGFTCSAKVGENTIRFQVEYDKYETYCNVKLYLIEEYDDINEIKELKTVIGHSVQPGNISFLENIERDWNIDQNDGENNSDGDGKLISDIDAIFLGLKTDYLFNKDLIEVLSQIYVLRMTALLGKSGALGNEVLDEYRALVNKYAVERPAILHSNAMLKVILDRVIREKNALPEIKKQHEKELTKIYKDFYEPLERINPKEKKMPNVTLTETIGSPKQRDKVKEDIGGKAPEEKKKSAAEPAPKKAKSKGAPGPKAPKVKDYKYTPWKPDFSFKGGAKVEQKDKGTVKKPEVLKPAPAVDKVEKPIIKNKDGTVNKLIEQLDKAINTFNESANTSLGDKAKATYDDALRFAELTLPPSSGGTRKDKGADELERS